MSHSPHSAVPWPTIWTTAGEQKAGPKCRKSFALRSSPDLRGEGAPDDHCLSRVSPFLSCKSPSSSHVPWSPLSLASKTPWMGWIGMGEGSKQASS